MRLNTITFAEAKVSPIAVPAEWSNDNLLSTVSVCLRDLIATNGIQIEKLDEPFDGFDELCVTINEQWVDSLTAAYHDASHARAVATRFRTYLAASGRSDVVQKLGFMAGLFHDAGHPGFRYREDAGDGVPHSELSNEEFAATLAVETLKDTVNTTQLAWLYSVIMATSFGQRPGGDPAVNKVLAERPHLVRPYGPVTPDQSLLHLADINSTSGPTGYEEFMDGGIKLAKEMAKGAPVSWTPSSKLAYAKSQAGFLGYIGMVLDKAKAAFSDAVFAESLVRDLTEVRVKVQHVITVWTPEALMFA